MKQKNTINRSKLNSAKQWEFYKKRAGKIYTIFLRYCNDKDEAWIILQSFFINLFQWKYTIPDTSDEDSYYTIRRYAIGFAIKVELKCTLEDFVRVQHKAEPIVWDSQSITLDLNDQFIAQFFQIKKNSPRVDWIIYNLIGIDGYSDTQVAEILWKNQNEITEIVNNYRVALSNALESTIQ